MPYFSVLGIAGAVILLGAGGFGLYDAVSRPTGAQTLELMTGAFTFALGLALAYFQGKMVLNWLHAMHRGDDHS